MFVASRTYVHVGGEPMFNSPRTYVHFLPHFLRFNVAHVEPFCFFLGLCFAYTKPMLFEHYLNALEGRRMVIGYWFFDSLEQRRDCNARKLVIENSQWMSNFRLIRPGLTEKLKEE